VIAVVKQELRAKDLQRRAEQTRSAIGMSARTPAGQQAGPALDPFEVPWRRRQTRDPTQSRGDCAEPEGARPALAGAFVREVPEDSSGLDDTASSRWQYGDHTATQRIAKTAQ
jgi:hypothetical protein